MVRNYCQMSSTGLSSAGLAGPFSAYTPLADDAILLANSYLVVELGVHRRFLRQVRRVDTRSLGEVH